VSDPGAALAAIVGSAHVASGEAAARHAVAGRTPRWVASPGTPAEVGGCLAVASQHGLAVAPTGRGTRLHWGVPPRSLDMVLSLHRLDRIVAHEPADLTMTAEAGVTLGAIRAHLAPHRQLLALDPPRAAGSTVGGIVATAASGPLRARYGTIRELLLGVTVARADGTLVKGGGRVVKNVTGYDMPKLFVGALGTLGVVVAAHLRLHAAPAVEASGDVAFASAEAALEAGLAVLDAAVVVSRLELFTGPAGTSLAVTVGSVEEGVRAQGARIEEICARAGGTARSIDEPEAWWAAATERTWPASPDELTLRLGVRTTDLVKALRVVEALAGSVARATAEVANGVWHLALARPADPGGLVKRIREGLAPLDGTCVVEHAPPDAAAVIDVWGDVGPALAPMRRLKAELDPAGILNPGRFVGGI
jgi:glycolate oxidase FAD binding subunit